ncbi:MAG: flagellar M-ring protein FliF C-terminal domain-containing protein, partial [Dehalobacterium sp.]
NKIFGPGKSIAVVNADLDFDAREKRVVTYGNPVVRTETGSRQEAGSIVGGEGGVAGTTENVPDYDAIDPEITEEQAAADLSTDNLEQYSRSYEVDATEETIVSAAGDVKKMSVAVLVDGQLTPVRATEVQNLVIAAVGLDPNRGDQITVSSMTFDTTLKDELEESFAEAAKQQELAELQEMNKMWAKIGLAALLVLVIGGVILRAKRTKRKAPLDVVIDEPVPISKVEEETIFTVDIMERKKQQEKARRYLEEQPEQAANVLKTWLSYEE